MRKQMTSTFNNNNSNFISQEQIKEPASLEKVQIQHEEEEGKEEGLEQKDSLD